MIENIDFKKEILLGLLIGGLFIASNIIFGLTLGVPSFSFSSQTEEYSVKFVVAPFAEELGFRGLLPFILALFGIPIWLSLAIVVFSFSIYHLAAYGSSVASASSLFVGAAFFGLTAFLATYYQSNPEEFQIPIAAIIGHVIANVWLGITITGLIITGVSLMAAFNQKALKRWLASKTMY